MQAERLAKEAERRGINGTNGETVENAVGRAQRIRNIFDRYQQNIYRAYQRPIDRLREKGDYQEVSRRMDRLREQNFGRGGMPLSRSAYRSGTTG